MLIAVAYVCWGLFIASWALGAIYNAWRAPKGVDGGSSLGFLARWALAVLAVWLVTRVVPSGVWVSATLANPLLNGLGAAVLVGSTLLTLWARWTLGLMWSSVPILREHHELRTSGPYRITRHPIYTGILGMLLGSAMLLGSVMALSALIVAASVFLVRIVREENLMIEAFGEQYLRYQREVPRLVPIVRF